MTRVTLSRTEVEIIGTLLLDRARELARQIEATSGDSESVATLHRQLQECDALYRKIRRYD